MSLCPGVSPKLEGSGSFEILLPGTALTVLMTERHLKVKTPSQMRLEQMSSPTTRDQARLAKNYPGDPRPLGVLVSSHCGGPQGPRTMKEGAWAGGGAGGPGASWGHASVACSPGPPALRGQQGQSLAGGDGGCARGGAVGHPDPPPPHHP